MVPLLLVLGLGAQVVCIDPGHPSEVGRGTRGKHVSELEAVWVLSQSLARKLRAAGITVVLTKSEQEQFVANKRRAEIANASKADLMLRLHMDAATERGFATYYPAYAGKVGKVEGPPKDVRDRSSIAGKAFHSAAIDSLAGVLADRGLKTDRQTAVGAKQGALTGSIYAKVPVLLVEVLVLTDPKDEAVYRSDKGRAAIVQALFEGTMAALGALGPPRVGG